MYACQRGECDNVGYIFSDINNNNSLTQTTVNTKRKGSIAGPVKCEQCTSLYCSEQCKELDKEIHKNARQCTYCTQLEAKEALLYLGYQSDNPQENYELFRIAGGHFFGFPGPVTGPIPKKFIPIREFKFFNLLTQSEKDTLMSMRYYYVVWSTHLPCVILKELTKEQKIQMRSVINQTKNVIETVLPQNVI